MNLAGPLQGAPPLPGDHKLLQQEDGPLTTPKQRPSTLLAAGLLAAGIGAATPAVAAELGGTILYESGKKIPEGRIEIFLETVPGKTAGGPGTQIESSGSSMSIAYALSGVDQATALQGSRIVARLERADGWLLARGSAKVTGDSVDITLFTVMY